MRLITISICQRMYASICFPWRERLQTIGVFLFQRPWISSRIICRIFFLSADYICGFAHSQTGKSCRGCGRLAETIGGTKAWSGFLLNVAVFSTMSMRKEIFIPLLRILSQICCILHWKHLVVSKIPYYSFRKKFGQIPMKSIHF